MSKKILHIAGCDKFIPPFIEFVRKSFNFSEHEFLLTSGMAEKELRSLPNVHLAKKSTLGTLKHYWYAVIKINQADKVILHGLFDPKVVAILFFMPWVLKKCYWVMWGGDLYIYQLDERNFKEKIYEFFRGSIIKNMGHLVTYIKGDVDLARKWYRADGQYHECIMYPSNVYKDLDVPEKMGVTLNIQVGNSADTSNNHIEVLEKLRIYKDDNILIYVPLSYGNRQYAEKVIQKGRLLFGKKFIPLTDFIPFDEYIEFLGSIDIAIFNHKRQQAMGNTITLIGLGKIVYMRSDTTQWQFFKDINIEVKSILGPLSLINLDQDVVIKNTNSIKNFFSLDKLKIELQGIFK